MASSPIGGFRIVEYTDEAKADLAEIYLSTARQWGQQQARDYLRMLLIKAQDIAELPSIARPIPELPGVRSIIARWKRARNGHRIIFQETASGIVILRIVHTARSWQNDIALDN